MKYIILFFLVVHSHLSIANCDFSGEVYPKEKEEEVKEMYTYTCQWFADVFEVSYDPSITLNSVSYEFYPDNIESLKDKNTPARFFGHFDKPLEKEINDIQVITYPGDTVMEEDEYLQKSILLHELIHFFTKKSSFEIMKDIELNIAMHEVITFWSQNQYIKMKTGKKLTDYMEDKKEEYVSLDPSFISMAEVFLVVAPEKFLHQAIHFLDEDRIGRFNKIVGGQYKNRSFSFRHVIGDR